MTTPLRYEDARLQRMEQATLWLQRMRDAGDDEGVVDAWLDWCQRDPLNQQAFDEIAAVWELSGRLAGEPRVAPAAPTVPNPRRRVLVAAAASLVLALGAGAWWVMRPQPVAVLTSEHSSPIGVNSVYTLADASVLELGGGTRVMVNLGPRERRVQLLDGELYVTVHHDAARPFLVEANGLEVIATGTAFNVRRTSQRTTVTVTEGNVKARLEGRLITLPEGRLKVGQQLVHSYASRGLEVRQADAHDAVAWRSGLLPFKSEPLAEVVETINRYSTGRIEIQDPRLGVARYTGTAHTNGTSEWLGSVPDLQIFPVPVVVEDLADGRHLIRPRTARRN